MKQNKASQMDKIRSLLTGLSRLSSLFEESSSEESSVVLGDITLKHDGIKRIRAIDMSS
jgi:hypothetical protein